MRPNRVALPLIDVERFEKVSLYAGCSGLWSVTGFDGCERGVGGGRGVVAERKTGEERRGVKGVKVMMALALETTGGRKE